MALATTCPKCQTSFRVAPDQLALRRGMVRCGVCQNVFSGMANLRHVEEILRQRSSARAAEQQALHPSRRATDLPFTDHPNRPSESVHGVRGSPDRDDNPGGGSKGAKERSGQGRVVGPAPSPEVNAPAVDSQEFAQTDLRTAFFLPETVFGPATKVLDASASANAEAAVIPESIQKNGTPADIVTDTPAIELRQPGPDTRIRWARESEQAKAENNNEETPTDSSRAERSTHDAASPDGRVAGAAPSADRPAASADLTDTGADTDNLFASAKEHLKHADRTAPRQKRRKRPVDRSDEAIAYFEPDASRIGFSSRAVAAGWLICVAAAILLAAQILLGARNTLAAGLPSLRAPLQSVSGWFGLEVEPPRDLQAVTIESFELQATETAGQLALSALLRNRAAYGVQWPALEVTLTDGQGLLLVRKVLLPAEYFHGLPANAARQPELGMNPRAELPLKLSLEARDLTPSGYSVTLFYP